MAAGTVCFRAFYDERDSGFAIVANRIHYFRKEWRMRNDEL
jgi:hypothetical protein